MKFASLSPKWAQETRGKACLIWCVFSVWDISMECMAKWMTPKRMKLLSAWEVGRQGNTEEVEKKWGSGGGSQRKDTPVDQSFPRGFQRLVPTYICRGALGLECQNIIMKRNLDFHCCTLKEFHDIQDSRKQCCQNSQKLFCFCCCFLFHNLMPGERGT